jgi:2-desacetyl-2-hydroxyethyl bacteriochlorophyllide A dehydrogenase
MRAAVFKAPGEKLCLEVVDDPIPAAGEAVIKVNRCGICGTDLHMTSGHGWDYPPGTIPGHEFSGEVVAVASDVSSLKVGDRVTALPAAGCGACAFCERGYPLLCSQMRGYAGGAGEYMRIAASTALILPGSVSLADGALVEPMAVGLHGAVLAELTPGARVLVLGAGAVALAATYWARELGAGRIVVASRSGDRTEMALTMGASAFVLTGDSEKERIERQLGGAPDVVLECAGAVGLLGQAINLVRTEGMVVSLGFCTSPDPVVPGIATCKQVTLKFSMAYTLTEFQRVIDQFSAGRVEPRAMVTQTVTLEAFPDAFEALRGGARQTKLHISHGW